MTIASLIVSVGANTVDFVKSIDAVGSQVNTLGVGLDKFAASAAVVGGGLTAALTVPIVGIGAAVIKMGMDAVESGNLVAVSFGDMKTAADEWASGLSKSLGLNRFETEKMAGVLFNMTTGMGLGRAAAFEMSTGVVKLAADMSSFRNIPMEDALLKIRSGLTGEAEPLKAIGILVDDATIKTYAYANGIAKQGSELTQQQKVMARWGAILQQTANDQGDLARTLESPANQLRIMKSRVEEAATALGVALMPMITSVIGGVASLVPYIQSAVEWFAGLSTPVKTAAVVLAALAAAAGPIVLIVASLAASIATALPLLATMGVTMAGASVAVGLLGSAMTVVGVAGASWKVGRWIGEASGLTDWVERTTGKLMGLSAAEIEGGMAARKYAEAHKNAVPPVTALADETTKISDAIAKEIAKQQQDAVAVAAAAAAHKAAEQATKAHTAAIKSLTDKYSGDTLAKSVRDLSEAMSHLEKDADFKTLATDIGKMFVEGAKLTPEMIRLGIAFGAIGPKIVPIGSAFKDVGTQIDVVAPKIDKVWDKLNAPIPYGISHLKEEFAALVVWVPKAVEKTGDFYSELKDVSKAMGTLGQIAGGAFGEIVGAGSQVIGSFAAMKKASEEYAKTAQHTFSQTAAYTLGWATTVFSAVKLMADGLDALYDTLTGSVVKAATEAHGGLAAFRNEALLANQDVDRLFSMDATEFKQELKYIEDAIKKQNEVMEKYNLTWRDFGQTVRQSNVDQYVRTLLADFRMLTAQGVEPTKVIKAQGVALNQLIVDAVQTGTKIPIALQPILEKLIRMGGLTDDAARAMLGLEASTMPALADIKDAADRYGLSLDQLGPKVQQLRITETAEQIVKDFNLLVLAGADVGTVMLAMQGQVQGLVTNALQLGLALPESMRPLINGMVDAGLLTDQFGNKLEDLSGLNFEQPLTAAIGSLIDKLNDLIDAFSHVGDSAEDGMGRVRGALEAVGHAVPRGTVVPRDGVATGGMVGYGRILPFTLGGRVPYMGTDTVPAMLTPGEMVLNAAQQKRVGNALQDGGGDIVIHHQTVLDGKVIDERITRTARKDAARGGMRPRVAAGRSY